MRAALALLVALHAAPSLAQEEVVADTSSATRAGFQIIVPHDEVGHEAFASEIDRLVVAPWMRQQAPGSGYSFSILNRDVDGDGFGDVVVSLRTAAQLTDGDGGAVLVSTSQGVGWSEPSLHEAIALGIRERKDGYGHEVAFIGENDFEIY